MPEERKPHFSPSQLTKIFICPESYRRWYIENDRPPPGMNMLRGTGFHKGAATNFAQKLTSHRDLKRSEIVEAGVAAYDAECKGGVTLTHDEAARGVAIVAGETRDDLAAMLDVHATAQAGCYQPIAVEESVRIELPGDRDLLGVLDLATDSGVVDFKTARRQKTQAEADSSLQLSVYHAAYHARFGYPPTTVALDVVVQTKSATKRQLLVSDRTDADLAALAARMNVASKMLQAGLFPPADAGSWQCSEKYCPYFNRCCYATGGRRSQND